jgi:hypothetical protein
VRLIESFAFPFGFAKANANDALWKYADSTLTFCLDFVCLMRGTSVVDSMTRMQEQQPSQTLRDSHFPSNLAIGGPL